MKLSTSTNILAFRDDGGHNTIDTIIPRLAAAGYDTIDVNFCEAMNPDSRLCTDAWEQYVQQIGRIAADCGVHITQSHAPYCNVLDPAYPKREQMEEYMRRSIIASGLLGVRWVVMHAGTDLQAGFDTTRSLSGNLAYFEPHVRLAQQCGTGITIENLFEYKPNCPTRRYTASIRELCELSDAFNSPHVGICYDFGHAHLTGMDQRHNLRSIGGRLKSLHVADNNGSSDEHLLPFFGTVDWQAILPVLKEIGYQGNFTYEVQRFLQRVPDDLKDEALRFTVSAGRRLIALSGLE